MLIPIHILYKIDLPIDAFKTRWEAGEILGYFGSIIGATSTILVLVLTINFTVENQKKERKLSIKPFLMSKSIDISRNDMTDEEKNGCIFVKYEGGVLYTSYRSNDLLIIGNEGDPLRDIITRLNNKRETCIIKYTVKNVGSGNALNFSLIITTGLPKNEILTFVFILGKSLLVNKRFKLVLRLEYEDEASISKYAQSETFTISKDENDFLNYIQVNDDLLSVPKEIEKAGELHGKVEDAHTR